MCDVRQAEFYPHLEETPYSIKTNFPLMYIHLKLPNYAHMQLCDVMANLMTQGENKQKINK